MKHSNSENNLKEYAIQKILELGCSIEEVAKQTGIDHMTLYVWVKEHLIEQRNNLKEP